MTQNPYESPQIPGSHSVPVAEERRQAAWMINQFLDGTLAELHRDEYSLLANTKDRTVQYAMTALGTLIEDYGDAASVSKSEWDHLERTRLALLSGMEIRSRRVYRNGIPEFTCVICLLSYLLIWIYFGFGWHIIACHVVLAAIAKWCLNRLSVCEQISPFRDVLHPFTGMSQLATAYKKTPDFKKRRKPWKQQPEETSPIAYTIGVLLFLVGAPVISFAALFGTTVATVVGESLAGRDSA